VRQYNLNDAIKAYWSATNAREEQAAYHEMLLFGGKDGYPISSQWRIFLARKLRQLAIFIEKRY